SLLSLAMGLALSCAGLSRAMIVARPGCGNDGVGSGFEWVYIYRRLSQIAMSVVGICPSPFRPEADRDAVLRTEHGPDRPPDPGRALQRRTDPPKLAHCRAAGRRDRPRPRDGGRVDRTAAAS